MVKYESIGPLYLKSNRLRPLLAGPTAQMTLYRIIPAAGQKQILGSRSNPKPTSQTLCQLQWIEKIGPGSLTAATENERWPHISDAICEFVSGTWRKCCLLYAKTSGLHLPSVGHSEQQVVRDIKLCRSMGGAQMRT